MSKNLSELSARKGLENGLFERISETALDKQQTAQEFLIGRSTVTGSISFYDFLKPENANKKIYVCNGSACLCAGTQPPLIEQLKGHFADEQIGHMTCLGRCHENGAFHYNGDNYSGLDAQQIETVIKGSKAALANDEYHCQHSGSAVLTKPPLSDSEMYTAIERLLSTDKKQLLKEINTAQLRGRGGAGFPIGFKLQSARDIDAQSKFIICNADEGDPGAYSDRYLLEQQPNLVLFGIVVSAYITGAQYGVLYIRAEYPQSIEIIKQAIKKITPIIEDTGFDFRFKIISAQGAYICGEESALINSIEGQRPEVRTRPPFPTQQGLFNQPTVVNNVETLAALYHIFTLGGESYQKLGTQHSSGTKLVSLDANFNRPGVYEVEMGTPLLSIFNDLGGGFKQTIKAVHIGGPLGGLIPVEQLSKLTLDFESFAEHGFLLGHASVVCIPESFPMIEYLQHLFSFAAYESCGKCFPCRLGTKRGEELFTNAIEKDQKIDGQLLKDLLNTLEQGSLCAHGGGIPLPINNALMYFKKELSQHINIE